VIRKSIIAILKMGLKLSRVSKRLIIAIRIIKKLRNSSGSCWIDTRWIMLCQNEKLAKILIKIETNNSSFQIDSVFFIF
jgi:hypothetical protein